MTMKQNSFEIRKLQPYAILLSNSISRKNVNKRTYVKQRNCIISINYEMWSFEEMFEIDDDRIHRVLVQMYAFFKPKWPTK